VSVSRELGADDRVVTVVQYLRVLIVIVTLPVVTALVFRADRVALPGTSADTRLESDLLYVAISLAAGMLICRAVPVTTAVLLAPLFVSAAISSGGWLGAVAVPRPIQWLGYALLGVQVGLRFTRASLVSVARMLPAVTALIIGLLLASAVAGTILAWTTSVDGLTAYLATTPGGLYAVLAIAAESGADVTYVMAMQLIRTVMILLLLPIVARAVHRSQPAAPVAPPDVLSEA